MSKINSPAASLEKFNIAISNYEYRNFPQDVMTYARDTLNKCEKDCWEFLYEKATFSDLKMIIICRGAIGIAIHRSVKTVGRLLKGLEEEGFIHKVRKNKSLEIHVRAPLKIIDKILNKNPRRMPCSYLEQRDNNVPSQRGQSYYLNNINNNSAVLEPKVPVAVQPVVVDPTPEIEKLERKKEETAKEITELHKFMIKNPTKKWETWAKIEELGRKETSLILQIERLKPPPRPSVFNPSASKRILCDFEQARLQRELMRLNRPDLTQEITFSVSRGDLGHGSVPRGISSALKLVRENRWGTPRGMRQ